MIILAPFTTVPQEEMDLLESMHHELNRQVWPSCVVSSLPCLIKVW